MNTQTNQTIAHNIARECVTTERLPVKSGVYFSFDREKAHRLARERGLSQNVHRWIDMVTGVKA